MKIKPENRFWIAIYGFTAFIMLVAMSVFGWLAWTSRQEPGTNRVAGGRPAAVVSTSLPDEEYELLAKFDAPAYKPLPKAPKAFQMAMALYQKQDYAGAASALRMVADSQPEFVPGRFYLGIALLLEGNRISGIQELRAISEAEPGPYLSRARFYLAKALIGEHDLKRAEEQLQILVDEHGEFEKQAAALLAQIHAS